MNKPTNKSITQSPGRSRRRIRSTTILCVSHKGQTVMVGDGQVTLGSSVLKQNAKKVRRLYRGNIVAGFAGSTADAFTLFERFEKKLEEYSGNLTRSAVELAKEWRTDRMLRRLEALLIVADKEHQYILSGSGDVIEPDNNIAAVGSGGTFAEAAASALTKHSSLSAEEIAREAMAIAGRICIYTNSNLTVEILD